MNKFMMDKSSVKGKASSVSIKAQDAFTLIEFILYTGVLAIVGVVMAGAFISIANSESRIESRTLVHSEARFIMEKIRQDIKEASFIKSPSFGESSDSLVLSVNESDVTYTVDANNRLTRNSSPISSEDVSIDTLNFEVFENLNLTLLAGSQSVNIDLTITSLGAQVAEYSFSQEATFSLSQLIFKVRGLGSTSLFGPPPSSDICNITGHNCGFY